MGTVEWIILIMAALVALVLVLVCVGFALGFGISVLWWLTAIFHAFKSEPPPSPTDDNWSLDQGEEVK